MGFYYFCFYALSKISWYFHFHFLFSDNPPIYRTTNQTNPLNFCYLYLLCICYVFLLKIYFRSTTNFILLYITSIKSSSNLIRWRVMYLHRRTVHVYILNKSGMVKYSIVGVTFCYNPT